MNKIKDFYLEYQIPKKKIVEPKNLKKFSFANLFGFLLFALSIFAVVLLSYAFSNILALTTVSIATPSQVIQSGFSFYVLQVNCLDTEEEALELATEVKSRGGAGYIFQDNGYHVFVSGYTSFDDANTVLEKLKIEYLSAQIYTLEINKIKLEEVNESAINNIKIGLATFQTASTQLYNTSILFDNSELSMNEFKTTLSTLITTCSQNISNFKEVSYKVNDTNIILCESLLDQLLYKLNNLLSQDLSINMYSALIKRTSIECILLQNDLGIMTA